MKILLVHNTYREPGGEDVAFESEKRLLEGAGHAVIPYVRRNAELQETSAFDRVAIATQMIWSWKARHEFAAIVESERPDIVHIHNTFMVISPSIYSVCAKRRIPVVQTLHNFRLLCPAANFFRDGVVCKECVEASLMRSVHHSCYRNSRGATAAVALMLAAHRALDTWRSSVTLFVTLTDFAKQQFVSAGFPPQRLVVKPNFAHPDPGERTTPGDYCVFVGRLLENKGLRVVLDAWSKLAAPYSLQVVGDGPDRSALESHARALGLSQVTFRGRLTRAATLEIVRGAQFTIVPSVLYEGLPMCIVESFACGTPVLCSSLGALTEVVEDGLTGLHFNPGDPLDLARKVAWAWSHPAELARMGRAARRKYEQEYTAEKNYSRLMQIYQQALGARSLGSDSSPVAQSDSFQHCGATEALQDSR